MTLVAADDDDDDDDDDANNHHSDVVVAFQKNADLLFCLLAPQPPKPRNATTTMPRDTVPYRRPRTYRYS